MTLPFLTLPQVNKKLFPVEDSHYQFEQVINTYIEQKPAPQLPQEQRVSGLSKIIQHFSSIFGSVKQRIHLANKKINQK